MPNRPSLAKSAPLACMRPLRTHQEQPANTGLCHSSSFLRHCSCTAGIGEQSQVYDVHLLLGLRQGGRPCQLPRRRLHQRVSRVQILITFGGARARARRGGSGCCCRRSVPAVARCCHPDLLHGVQNALWLFVTSSCGLSFTLAHLPLGCNRY